MHLAPFSKRRRKAGGKSARHPGGGEKHGSPKTEEIQIPDKGWQLDEAIENDPGSALYQRFKHGYAGAFHEKYDFEGPHDSSSLLDIITENAFDATGSRGTLLPVSKAALLLEYLVERDDLDAAHANAEAGGGPGVPAGGGHDRSGGRRDQSSRALLASQLR